MRFMAIRPAPLWATGKVVVLIALIIQLMSCGYQLRGSDLKQTDEVATLAELGPLYIESGGNSAFYNLLRSKLQSASVALTNDVTEAQYRLKVFDMKTRQSPISYDQNGDVAEYRKQSSLSYELLDSTGAPAINAKQLRVEDIFQSNKNNISADRSKQAEIQRELAQKLVNQIFWALKTASLKNQTAQPVPK